VKRNLLESPNPMMIYLSEKFHIFGRKNANFVKKKRKKMKIKKHENFVKNGRKENFVKCRKMNFFQCRKMKTFYNSEK